MQERYDNKVRLAVMSLTNSYSQIFFSNNKLLSLLVLMVSFIDFYAGISGLISIVITNATAFLLGLDKHKIAQGYYGFNSLLVGLGIGIYFNMSEATILIVFLASIISLLTAVAAEAVFGKYSLPYLSIPFVFTLWIISIATREFSVLGISIRGVYSYNDLFALGGKNLTDAYEWGNNISLPKSIRIYFLSLGAIVFQNNLIAGIILAVAIFVYSRIAFVLTIVGFYVAYVFYQILGADINEMYYGYIGFNFILTAIALGGYYLMPNKFSFVAVVIIIPVVSIITIALSQIFIVFQLPIYSLPFNVVVLMCLNILKYRTRNFNTLQPVYIQHHSPEKNLYSIMNYQKRFKNDAHLPILLPFHGAWKVTQGHNGEITHKNNWRHAWDFEIVDQSGKSYKNSGDYPEDYYCYNKNILASADGVVEEVVDGIPDNIIGSQNLRQNWGNTIIIKHYEALYSKYSHIKQGSIKVKKGQLVKAGDILAQVGNSGRSPVPHLHFQLQANPYIGSETISYPFSSYVIKNTDSQQVLNFCIPQINQIVENIQANSSLKKAFDFVSGQKLTFTEETGKQYDLYVKTNYYGRKYIYCSTSNSYAYFRSDGKTIYFEHFEGDKNSVLFFLYLSAFKVQMSLCCNQKFEDVLPVNSISPIYLLWAQDIVAPFYTFIKTLYSMQITKADEDFTDTHIELQSSVELFLYRKKINKINFKFFINDSGIEKLVVETNQKSKTFICTKE